MRKALWLALSLLVVPSSAAAAVSVRAQGAQLVVAWDPSPDPQVAGYRVFVASVSGAYAPSVDVGKVLQYVYTPPSTATVYFAVSSYYVTNGQQVVGPRSPEVFGSTGAAGGGASPNGATATVGSGSVVDSAGHVWTLRAPTPATQGRETDRDGEHVGGGYGDLVLWWGGNVYVQAFDTWWLWSVSSWVQIPADPRTAMPPPPPPPTAAESCAPDGSGNGVDENRDGRVDEGCKPKPPVVTPVRATCKVSATKPDSTTGWTAQFRRNGVNTGSADSSSPYERTVEVTAGPSRWDVVWTKGATKVVSAEVQLSGECR